MHDPSGDAGASRDGAAFAALEGDDLRRLENLRADLAELRSSADPALPPPRVEDGLLARLVRAGSAYATLPRTFLAGCGFTLTPPGELADEDLRGELWRLIWILALLRLLLDHTDHLSDRQLYARLYDEVLNDPTTLQPGAEDASVFVCDLLPGSGDAERRLLLAHYSDRLEEDERALHLSRLEGEAPEPRPRPYDRDRFLP
ncbi:MAG: hypothetical protein AAF725_00865 [Acidobacteriota bacterium]